MEDLPEIEVIEDMDLDTEFLKDGKSHLSEEPEEKPIDIKIETHLELDMEFREDRSRHLTDGN